MYNQTWTGGKGLKKMRNKLDDVKRKHTAKKIISFSIWLDDPHRTSTEHKTASLADEGNSAYFQSTLNIKHM